MGYTTDFYGSFNLSKQPTPEQVAYINAFSETKRMKRNATITAAFPDPIREAVNLPIGVDSEYYVGAEGENMWGKKELLGIIEYNRPPREQPGLWCQWILEDGGEGFELTWDQGEKFYEHVEWLRYLINNFFDLWGIELNGEVTWQGEDSDDFGKIVLENSKLTTLNGRKVYE